MLPNLRFAVGAVLASLVLIVTAFGLAATVRIAHQAKVGPFEATRTLAYADPTDWNQFYDAEGTRRFDGMGHKTDGAVIDALIERASISAPVPAAASAKPAADPEPRAEPKPLLEPKPPIETSAPAATELTATIKSAAVDTVVVESAPATKDADSAVAEPVPAVTPSERVATLPSPSDTAAIDRSAEQASAPGAQVQTAVPNAKPTTKAKKKVAKRKPSPRTAKKPAAETGFPIITTRNGQDNWLFNRN